jgi:hypothetical protein
VPTGGGEILLVGSRILAGIDTGAVVTHQKRDTKIRPRRQEVGMKPPLPNSALGDRLISAKPRGTARFFRDVHM